MKLQNNFTTIEQSNRLLEIGLPADSADLLYDNEWLKIDEYDPPIVLYKTYKFTDYNQQVYAPCWSVGRLEEILKICITDKKELEEIFEYLKDTYDSVECLIQIYKDWLSLLDFSKLED